MDKSGLRKFIFNKNFGLLIGLILFSLFAIVSYGLDIFDGIDRSFNNLLYAYRHFRPTYRAQEGVTITENDPNINEDIVLIAIDDRTLDTFGSWPFPREVHSRLINYFSRINNQNERENSLFLDIFFIEPNADASQDLLLRNAIRDNGRVYLETVLSLNSDSDFEAELERFERHERLFAASGQITQIHGAWESINADFYGLYPPLGPFADEVRGFGHANFFPDTDSVFRRQILIAKLSQLVDAFYYSEFPEDLTDFRSDFVRYAWLDQEGRFNSIPGPITRERIEELQPLLEARGLASPVYDEFDQMTGESDYIIRVFHDTFIPSITLALAANYYNVPVENIEVVLGQFIRLPNPQVYNVENDRWEDYDHPEILIPIDENGQMEINFQGPRSSEVFGEAGTFPVRSYSAYARPTSPDTSTWRDTRAVGNKILMLGPFSKGMADDEKLTPYGLMYGVEIHANALNTILTQNFIQRLPEWQSTILLFLVIMIVAFVMSRFPTYVSFPTVLTLLIVHFLLSMELFRSISYIIPFSSISLSIVITMISIILYRIMTEEKDKRRIRETFGKFVSPEVVSQMMDKPPELGGIDRGMTVLFSDIRGFTTLSEGLTPQELVNHLNVYLTAMTDVIMEYKGTLDKYVGDEIMCFWGAPLEQPNHAELACKCALKQMEVLGNLNETWPESKRIDIGIGLNSGLMTVGNMGSSGRMNYTIMGDNVNLGARLEGTNKEYKTHIIISEFTYNLVKDNAIVRELDNIRVKGKNKPVLIFELLGFKDGYDPPKK